MASNNTPFIPKHLVVLAELDTREKEKYYNIMLSNGSKFHRTENGQYVLNMRILAPGVKKQNIASSQQKEQQMSNSLPFEERLQRLKADQPISVQFAGQSELFDYNSYPRFSVLIANDGDTVNPRPKLLSWLMRAIEEMYDARFAHEAAEVGRGESDFVAEQVSNLFPAFVVKRLSTRVGLRSLVDQTSWDLLYNSHVYRRDYLEVEMFCRFLQEFYDHDDLLFFLYVRSVVAKQLHVSFKTRWTKSDGPSRQPKALWLSYRECVHVAKTVFGDANESMCRDFLSIVQPQMVGQKGGGSGAQQQDTRRIDITQFLHLAVVGYHQTRPEDQQGDDDPLDKQHPQQPYRGGGGEMDFGMDMRGSGEEDRDMPASVPSGGDYMSRFHARGAAATHSARDSSDGRGDGVYQTQNEFARGGEFSEEDGYLSRLQQDREELLQMQQQGREGGGERLEQDPDAMFDNNQDFNDPISRLQGEDSFNNMDIDLAALAAENNNSNRNYGRTADLKPSTGAGLSLADFARQRQQEAALGQQFSGAEDEEEGSEEQENLADIQSEREREFLEMFCVPVYEFPEDIASSIVEELAERLHHMLTGAVEGEVGGVEGLDMDPDEFDEVVVQCLQAEALQADMVAARDLMLTYVQDRM